MDERDRKFSWLAKLRVFCLNHVFRAYQNPEYILLGVMRFCYVRFIMRKKKIGGNVCMEILFGEKGEIGSPG